MDAVNFLAGLLFLFVLNLQSVLFLSFFRRFILFFLLIFWCFLLFCSIYYNSFLGRLFCLDWCFLSFSWALLTLFALNRFSESTHHIIEGTSMSDFFISWAFRTFLSSSFPGWCNGRCDSLIFDGLLHFYRLSFSRRLLINKSIINMVKIFRAHRLSILTSSHIFRIWNFRWCLISFDFDPVNMHNVSILLWFLLILLSFVSTWTFSFLLLRLSHFLLTHFNLRSTFLKELCWFWVIYTFDFFNQCFVLLANSLRLNYFNFCLTFWINNIHTYCLTLFCSCLHLRCFGLKWCCNHGHTICLTGRVDHLNLFNYTNFTYLISLRAV